MPMIALNTLSQVGIGTSRVASLGSRLTTDAFATLLATAAAQQVNLIDTSDFYGAGDAERLIRRCVQRLGQPFFIMTKGGLPTVSAPGWVSPLNQLAKKVKQRFDGRSNYTARYLIGSVQRSNTRLGVEATDAFMLHEPAWSDLADSDAWDGLATIRQRGLARYTGVSTNDYQVVEAGIASGQVQVVQTAVAWNDPASDPITQLCDAHGIPVIANQTLRPYKALQQPFDQHQTLIHQFDGLAGMSLAQFLIAAALNRPAVKSVLFGTSNLGHLQHNLAATAYAASLPPVLPTLTQLLS